MDDFNFNNPIYNGEREDVNDADEIRIFNGEYDHSKTRDTDIPIFGGGL